jgi:hypothetical protein
MLFAVQGGSPFWLRLQPQGGRWVCLNQHCSRRIMANAPIISTRAVDAPSRRIGEQHGLGLDSPTEEMKAATWRRRAKNGGDGRTDLRPNGPPQRGTVMREIDVEDQGAYNPHTLYPRTWRAAASGSLKGSRA